jgi:hypothetical protein
MFKQANRIKNRTQVSLFGDNTNKGGDGYLFKQTQSPCWCCRQQVPIFRS